MNDDAGFIRAIQENPDDDAARLVYADWLEERGDVRGQYLRLEWENQRLPARLAELQTQIAPSWMAAVRRKKAAESVRKWHDLEFVLAQVPGLAMGQINWMTWDTGESLRLRLGIWSRPLGGQDTENRFSGPTELRCQRVTDWALRPISPGWLLGGPQIHFHDRVDAAALRALGYSAFNTREIPHTDEDFSPPLKLQLLVLERGFVIGERFEMAEVDRAAPAEANTPVNRPDD